MMNKNRIQIGDYLIVELNQNNQPVQIEKITKSEFTALDNAFISLYESNYHFRRAQEVLFNIEDFSLVINKHLEILNSKSAHSDYGEIAFVDANRVMNNIVSSNFIFYDHFDKAIIEEYGENSDTFYKTKAILNNAFDNFFEYRFFSQLRNYSQHADYIIQNLRYTEGDPILNSTLIPYARKTILLANKKLSSKLKADLESYEEFIQLDILIPKIKNILELTSDKLLLLEIENKWNHIEAFNKVISKYPNSYKLGFCQVYKSLDGIDNIELNQIPQSLVKSFIDHKNKSD